MTHAKYAPTSASGTSRHFVAIVARTHISRGGWLTSRPLPSSLPNWITEADIDFYVAEFQRSEFRGGLNWYRNIDRNWELLAPWTGARVTVPALYIAGEQDLVVKFPGAEQLIANLVQFVPKLQKTIMLRDCGHWTQQEKPNEVNSAIIAFLKELDSLIVVSMSLVGTSRLFAAMRRHCEQRNDEAIHSYVIARRWIASLSLAMTRRRH